MTPNYAHADFKMADLATVKELLEGMSDQNTVYLMNASYMQRVADGQGYRKNIPGNVSGPESKVA